MKQLKIVFSFLQLCLFLFICSWQTRTMYKRRRRSFAEYKYRHEMFSMHLSGKSRLNLRSICCPFLGIVLFCVCLLRLFWFRLKSPTVSQTPSAKIYKYKRRFDLLISILKFHSFFLFFQHLLCATNYKVKSKKYKRKKEHSWWVQR